MQTTTVTFLIFIVLGSLSGLLGGWISGEILHYFLFFPTKKRRILGFSFQGIIPRRMQTVINVLSEELIIFLKAQEVKNFIENTALLENMQPFIEREIDLFLSKDLHEKLPIIGSLIGERTTKKMKQILMEKIAEILPTLMLHGFECATSPINKSKTETIIKSILTNRFEKNRTLFYATSKCLIRPFLLTGLCAGLFSAIVDWLFIAISTRLI